MDNLLERICVDPNVCHGQPCIKGTERVNKNETLAVRI